MIDYPKPNVFISKCLGFEDCRWNGVTIPDKFVKKMLPYINYITACPEVEIGLGAPRNPIRIIQIKNQLFLVQPKTKNDVTDKMLDFSDKFLESVKKENLDGFIHSL